MQRTLIVETSEKIGEEVSVSGWIETVRLHGKIAFFDMYDRSAVLQVVATSPEVVKEVQNLSQRSAVNVTGKVKRRDERFINLKIPTGTVELEATKIEILSKADTLPFDMGGKDLKLELPTLLDYRSLSLKHETQRDIFKVQAS